MDLREDKRHRKSPNFHNNLIKLLGNNDMRKMLLSFHNLSVTTASVCKDIKGHWNGYTNISEIDDKETLEEYDRRYHIASRPETKRATLKAAMRLHSLEIVTAHPRDHFPELSRIMVKSNFTSLVPRMHSMGYSPPPSILIDAARQGNAEIIIQVAKLFPSIYREYKLFTIVMARSLEVLNKVNKALDLTHDPRNLFAYLQSGSQDIYAVMAPFYHRKILDHAMMWNHSIEKLDWLKQTVPDLEITERNIIKAVLQTRPLEVIQWLTNQAGFRWRPDMISNKIWLQAQPDVLRWIIEQSGWECTDPEGLMSFLVDQTPFLTSSHVQKVRYARELGITSPQDAFNMPLSPQRTAEVVDELLKGEEYDWSTKGSLPLILNKVNTDVLGRLLPHLSRRKQKTAVWFSVVSRNLTTARFLKQQGLAFRMLEKAHLREMEGCCRRCRENAASWFAANETIENDYPKARRRMLKWWAEEL
jgi:hypothetical protein